MGQLCRLLLCDIFWNWSFTILTEEGDGVQGKALQAAGKALLEGQVIL